MACHCSSVCATTKLLAFDILKPSFNDVSHGFADVTGCRHFSACDFAYKSACLTYRILFPQRRKLLCHFAARRLKSA
jgi:hypothetical protein